MKMEENQLKELVEKAKQGDYAAFGELYSVSSRQVYFTCISFLGNEEDAKDVMQDVFITAYEKLSSLNDAEKFFPWINRIAVNLCKKFLIKKPAVFMEIENAANELTEENENFLPEEYITQKEKRKLVMDIMRNTLSDIQYKTVILYYFNGLPVEEIADIMECPPGTVKYRLSVARAKIRDGVDAYENRSGDKLYSVVGLPLLMRLLYAEADSIDVPDMLHGIMESVRLHLEAGAAKSAAAAGETAGQTESGAAAGKASQNTIDGIANGVKGGIMKTGANTIIAKIAIAAAVVMVIAAGAVFFIKNSREDEVSDSGTRGDAQEQTSGYESGDSQGQTADHESEDDSQGQTAGSYVDWDAVEEYGYPPFWLKYANLGALEQKDFSGLMFYDKFAFGASLEDMISSFNYFRLFKNNNQIARLNSLGELMEFAASNTSIIGAKNYIEIHCYTEEGNNDDSMTFQVYNLTDSDATIYECIENNQFIFTSAAVDGYDVFGVAYDGRDYADNRAGLSELMEVLGQPVMVTYDSDLGNKIAITGRESGETFAETVSKGGGEIFYHLVYLKGDYILGINITEKITSDVRTTRCSVSYLTQGLYQFGKDDIFSDLIEENTYEFK